MAPEDDQLAASRDDILQMAERASKLTDELIDAVRLEVKDAVEENFSNVDLDDLFKLKGWKRRE